MQNNDIKIVVATKKDLELILAWRSHPDIYRYFRVQKGPLTWLEHISFWERRKNRIDFMVIYKEKQWRKVGTINISQLDEASPAIGILVGELTLQKKGVGSKALQLGLRWMQKKGFTQATAEIHKDNIASQRLFEKLGFCKTNVFEKVWGIYVCNLHDRGEK